VNRTSEKIYSYAKFSIHPGKLAEFKRLAGECSRIVNEEEPGTLFYEWFMNADETECVALDCYRHIRHIGPLMRSLMAISDRYLEIYGKNPFPVLGGTATSKSGEFYGPRVLGKI